MIDPQSRYFRTDIATMTKLDASGQPHEVRYLRRRFLPPPPREAAVEHRVMEGDRLDMLATRYVGDPRAFHWICDSNVVLSPHELTEEVGRIIYIALPGVDL